MDCLFGYELVTQTYESFGGNTDSKIDISIPSGLKVTGSGAIATHWWNNSTEQFVEIDYTSTVGGSLSKKIASGPHPTDSTKWRFQFTGTTSIVGRYTLWIGCVG